MECQLTVRKNPAAMVINVDAIAPHHPINQKLKKCRMEDLLTIFSDKLTMQFVRPDGTSDLLIGRWCKECK